MGESRKERHTLWVAIVGSGPSGFYAAEALLRGREAVRVDMFERLPTPYGLVRSGVAPDHPKLKGVTAVYERIASDPRYRLFGGVSVGTDVQVAELLEHYHAVVVACGAECDRRLGIPGEDLPGSHTATAFVAWYNGHPDYADCHFPLDTEVVAVIGQGNVAADVARVLAKTVDELKHTDIAQHALEALAESRVREIHVIGRRGPAQAKFTHKELREFGELADCDPIVDPADLELNEASRVELADPHNAEAAHNMALFRRFAERGRTGASRQVHFRFLLGPRRIEGEGRVERLVLERNRLEGEPFAQRAVGTGELATLGCGMVLRSIGYFGRPLPGLPFDQRRGVIPNRGGRVLGEDGRPLPGCYVTGWIKRGPQGIIGTNRADAAETVAALLEDLGQGELPPRPGGDALVPLLAARGVRVVGFEDWRRIDRVEIERGRERGKPREKLVRIADMHRVLDEPR